jgi:hypothetical protein
MNAHAVDSDMTRTPRFHRNRAASLLKPTLAKKIASTAKSDFSVFESAFEVLHSIWLSPLPRTAGALFLSDEKT